VGDWIRLVIVCGFVILVEDKLVAEALPFFLASMGPR
jgi:hypothetical protein